MTGPDPHQVTRILEAVATGEARAADQLLELVYDELRRLAGARMAGESPARTLKHVPCSGVGKSRATTILRG